MIIEFNECPETRETTIERFANTHGLVMVVDECTKDTSYPHRYHASFKHCDILEGHTLSSHYGSGLTQAQAMRDYAIAISGKPLVVDAMDPGRRLEIYVPKLNES